MRAERVSLFADVAGIVAVFADVAGIVAGFADVAGIVAGFADVAGLLPDIRVRREDTFSAGTS